MAEGSLNAQVAMLRGTLREQGITVEGQLVEDWPAEAIVKTAAVVGADLIVMGSRGLTKLTTVFLGSVAQQVISRAECPVLVLTTSSHR